MKLKCHKCHKEWEYKGKKRYSPNYRTYVTCPRCHSLIKIENVKAKDI